MEKRWKMIETNDEIVSNLHDALGINRIFCALLVSRGIETFDQAKAFFRMNESQLHDPYLLKDMDKAIARIKKAVDANEKILLFGDYDVDGTTSVALVYSYFKHFYENIIYYIPNRFKEGYGLSQQGIDYAASEGVGLIITLDCGINSSHLIQIAKDKGIDTVVCDHHMPGSELPNAIAILNPKQADCTYPYKELCGCGVGYKLISAYALQENHPSEWANEFIDLLATAIAADIVPITGENRVLAHLGLAKANTNPCLPIRALKTVSSLEKELSIRDLVFIIGPRVNAAGRMDDAMKAVELFIEKDEEQAKQMALVLDEQNKERVELDKTITFEASELLAQSGKYSTVVYNEHWHKGIVGIVASRLIEKSYKPTIVLTESNGFITGSARSIHGFNLFDGLNQCADLLENFGGHFYAAGLTLKKENLALFQERFDAIVEKTLVEDQFVPELHIDAELSFEQINFNFLKIIEEFAPHGPGNLSPVFITRNVTNHRHFSKIVNHKHIRFVLRQWDQSEVFNGIGFHMAEKFDIVQSEQTFDIVYHLDKNVWQEKESIQLRVLDIKASSAVY